VDVGITTTVLITSLWAVLQFPNLPAKLALPDGITPSRLHNGTHEDDEAKGSEAFD
jgi:hypothetical protein